MARGRWIKPEFWAHEDMSALSADTALLAIALLNYADDEGYFSANPALIKAACFPLRDLSVAIPESLQSLSRIGYVRLGKDSNGKLFGQVINFGKHQKVSHASTSKIKGMRLFWENSGDAPELLVIPPAPLQSKSRASTEPLRPSLVKVSIDKNQNPTASAEPVAARAPAKAVVDPKIMDLKVGIVAAYEHANILGTPDTAVVEEWFVSIPNFSPDLALASVKSQLSTMGKPVFKQLTYFEPRIRQKHEERFGAAGGATPGQVASARPRLVAREDAVCEGDKPLPDQTAHNMIDLWERGGPWAPPLGMRPDQRGCRVPMDILQARGYRDEHGRMSDRYLELRAEARSKRDLVRNSLEPIPKAAPNGGATH